MVVVKLASVACRKVEGLHRLRLAAAMQGNPFGGLFRQAASKVGAACREDNFDTSTVEVRHALVPADVEDHERVG